MRQPADGGSSDGARCCRCAVPGASFFVCVSAPRGWVERGRVEWEKMEETRHPSHRRYRWWSGMLKGALAGASPTGPWTDGRTGVRTPDHDERQPWRIPLDRPCLLPVWVQKLYSEKFGQACCAPPTPCASSGTCVNVLWCLPERLGIQGLRRRGIGVVVRQPREGCTASGSLHSGHFPQEGDVHAPGWRVSFWLEILWDFPIRVSVPFLDGFVRKPVHQFGCGGCMGAWEVVTNAVHGAHSVFRPPRGGGIHTAHCFVQRSHHRHAPVAGEHC